MNKYLIATLAGVLIISQIQDKEVLNSNTNSTYTKIYDISETSTINQQGTSVLGANAMVVDKHYDSILGHHDFSQEADH